MRILCTFPGRYGDIAWALPTIRALSRRIGAPVDLQIAGEFASIVPLLELQPYLGKVYADLSWALTPPDEWRAPRFHWMEEDTTYEAVLDLGYRGWPIRPLPFETLDNLNRESRITGSKWTLVGQFTDAELDLQTPWITPSDRIQHVGMIVGFTEAWFELKLGLLCCVSRRATGWLTQLTPPRSRWTVEVPGDANILVQATDDWRQLANLIAGADLFFGDCSALHVLAVALGTPVLVCEPMEARHNPIFYPLGMAGPQVTVVNGNDGNFTFDARHCADAITAALAAKDHR